MSQPPAGVPGTLVRVSVPAQGDLRIVVADLAAQVAEYVGQPDADAASFTAAVDAVAARVAPPGGDGDITFEFRKTDDGLLIEARCGARTSEVRCPLPA